MGKSLAFIKNKMSLVVIAVAVIVVGGFTTARVVATTPPGQVIICSNDTTKALTISVTGSCSSGSTPLNMTQLGGPIAYAHIVFAPFTAHATIDTAHSKNIAAIQEDPTGNSNAYCLTMTGGTPKNISTAPGFEAFVTQASLKDATGWSSDTTSDPAFFCGTTYPLSNIALNANTGNGVQTDVYITVY